MRIISFAAAIAMFAGSALAAGGGGGGSGYGSADSNESRPLRDAKILVGAGDYKGAIPKLQALSRSEPDNADVFNLLGFSYRKSGDTDRAGPAYETALRLNPKHRGALEYQGELFLMLGQVDKAVANLAKLDEICWLTCDEERDLENAIAAWRDKNGS